MLALSESQGHPAAATTSRHEMAIALPPDVQVLFPSRVPRGAEYSVRVISNPEKRGGHEETGSAAKSHWTFMLVHVHAYT